MHNDTGSIAEAEQKAKALGAVTIRVSYYPPRVFYGEDMGSGVFVYYYFNVAGDEVGHYIPDLNSFTEFDPPRKWSEEFLDELSCAEWRQHSAADGL